VIAKKRELLARTPAGREVLERLVLVPGDVMEADLPESDVAIAEGLMMYLDGDARRRLFAKIRAPRFFFDLVPSSEEPPPGRVGALLEAAMKRFTGGRSFERDARTREQIADELRAAGFSDVRAIAAADVARAWDLPHPERATTMVVFSASRASRA
jgi:O-methyltransferase involved in polyketide biosynthesis